MKLMDSVDSTFLQERRVNLFYMLLFNTIYLTKGGHWRANYIRNHNIFHSFGTNCYHHPRKIHTDAYMVSIGNNVCIAADVKFVTHDVFDIMLNNSPKYKNLAVG